MSGDEVRFLNVRETARRLDVHENTVRNWVRDGALPDARVPGSRYLRFRESDVARLQEQRGARTPSLQTERRTFNPELVTASQLKQWPSTRSRDAQQVFPELVRRLLVETAGITNISVRAGDGVAAVGYDGLADSTGTAFLPAGQLVLEFGVNESPASKATSDYDERAKDADPAQSFIFITPRRWAGKSKWAGERRQEGLFADVRALDADDLEGWLHASPGALFWISEHLGLRPREATTLDAWWDRFASATEPRLPAQLHLSGRETEAQKLVARLSARAVVTAIESERAEDCYAFAHAALTHQNGASDGNDVAVVLVSSSDTWNSVISASSRLTLIPLFEDADVDRAVSSGHHVIIAIDRSAFSRRQPDIVLPRIARQQAREALQEAGFDFGTADRFAALARRSMPALRRRLALNPKVARPDWSQNSDAQILAPLVLVGSWTTTSSDLEFIAAAVGRDLQDVDEVLTRVSGLDDPPVRRVGNTWSFTSQEEAFLMLRPYLSKSAVTRVLEASRDVLTERNPALGLEASERALAESRGTARQYSATVRRGVAEGLALLGAMGQNGSFEDGLTLSETASQFTQRLLLDALEDVSGRSWHQLAEVLPLLSEAAPEAFLQALEDDLGRIEPTILGLFQEEDLSRLSLGPSSPHPYVLWALETLCWNPEYLIDSVRILAKLALREPGRKSGNHPIKSLASVLSGWVRHTSASLQEKIEAVATAYAVSEDVGWSLTFELWPSDHSLVIPPASPRFRDWLPSNSNLPMQEWVEFTRSLVAQAIDHVGASVDRLGRLTEGLVTVPPAERDRLLELLEQRARLDDLDGDSRLQLWEKVHALAARHERFPDAAWALPSASRDRLKLVANLLEPQNDVLKFSYLFDWRPDLADVDLADHEVYDSRLNELRHRALNSVLQSKDGFEKLTELTRRAAAPAQVGWALAAIKKVEVEHLIEWLGSTEQALKQAAMSWTQRRAATSGTEWFARALRAPGLEGSARQLFIACAPPNRDIWSALRDSPIATDSEIYWTTSRLDLVSNPSDAVEAIEQLTRHQRAWAAISVASFALQESDDLDASKEELDTEAVVLLLESALTQTQQEADVSNMSGYHVGRLLDFLAKYVELDSATARFEYGFARLLEHTREPAVLNRALASQPEIFVDLVMRVYRGKTEPRRELSEVERGQATQAWWVLREWRGFPGCGSNGLFVPEVLNEWVKSARLALSEADRSDIGDEVIGQSFAHSPAGSDEIWPAEPLRDLIESIGSRELENGIVIGKINSRGVTTRGVYDGGRQEHHQSGMYRGWARAVRAKWPRTARLLGEIADFYSREARRQDVAAELHSDRD